MKEWLARLAYELRRIRSQGRKALLGARIGSEWRDGGEALARRSYPDYETYLEHQRTKLDAMRLQSLRGHDARFFAALGARLDELYLPLRGRSVLCLAARQGTEVRAFIDRGAFAIGVDLNPGRENRHVVVGDFHHLQFADGSVDIVYSNSFDHAFDLAAMMAEIRRVLSPDGCLIAEVGAGTEEGGGAGFYEALAWGRADEAVERMTDCGFHVEHRDTFEVPWRGVRVVLRPVPRPGSTP